MENDPTTPPLTPATEQGDLAMPGNNKVVWPSVIGILSIIIGILSIIIGCLGLLSYLFAIVQPLLGGQLGYTSEQIKSIGIWLYPKIASDIFAASLAILLIYSSIKLLQRKYSACKNLLWWAGLKIVHAVFATCIGAIIMPHIMQQGTNENQFGNAPMGESLIQVFTIIGIFFSLSYLLAWPIFILIWLRRPEIKDHVYLWQG